ncbi:MAG TPA: histidine kinase [Luteibaculaceae bacterium]|nr:histidine kinase [Luteibaculaceae bacterium]
MGSNRTVYWVAQFSGWLLYATLLVLYNVFFGPGLQPVILKSVGLIVLVGIALTHLYRNIIVALNWLNQPILRAVGLVLMSSALLGTALHASHAVLSNLLIPELDAFNGFDLAYNLQMVINWIILVLFWSVLYFTTHYFANYKKEEIKNLQMLASQNEIELTNLKSQLNPHFMFNALNSIRALVDEDPKQAKKAITQLSSMLRGALQTGRRQLIPLEEELHLVKSYLSIEKIRFEERLQVSYRIADDTLSYQIPPLMIQTLVENAVKHGISSLTLGGEIAIETLLDGEKLCVKVSNSGLYDPQKSSNSGIGLKNTERRLRLLYGEEASMIIKNENQQVITVLNIPKNLMYENLAS